MNLCTNCKCFAEQADSLHNGHIIIPSSSTSTHALVSNLVKFIETSEYNDLTQPYTNTEKEALMSTPYTHPLLLMARSPYIQYKNNQLTIGGCKIPSRELEFYLTSQYKYSILQCVSDALSFITEGISADDHEATKKLYDTILAYIYKDLNIRRLADNESVMSIDLEGDAKYRYQVSAYLEFNDIYKLYTLKGITTNGVEQVSGVIFAAMLMGVADLKNYSEFIAIGLIFKVSSEISSVLEALKKLYSISEEEGNKLIEQLKCNEKFCKNAYKFFCENIDEAYKSNMFIQINEIMRSLSIEKTTISRLLSDINIFIQIVPMLFKIPFTYVGMLYKNKKIILTNYISENVVNIFPRWNIKPAAIKIAHYVDNFFVGTNEEKAVFQVVCTTNILSKSQILFDIYRLYSTTKNTYSSTTAVCPYCHKNIIIDQHFLNLPMELIKEALESTRPKRIKKAIIKLPHKQADTSRNDSLEASHLGSFDSSKSKNIRIIAESNITQRSKISDEKESLKHSLDEINKDNSIFVSPPSKAGKNIKKFKAINTLKKAEMMFLTPKLNKSTSENDANGDYRLPPMDAFKPQPKGICHIRNKHAKY